MTDKNVNTYPQRRTKMHDQRENDKIEHENGTDKRNQILNFTWKQHIKTQIVVLNRELKQNL